MTSIIIKYDFFVTHINYFLFFLFLIFILSDIILILIYEWITRWFSSNLVEAWLPFCEFGESKAAENIKTLSFTEIVLPKTFENRKCVNLRTFVTSLRFQLHALLFIRMVFFRFNMDILNFWANIILIYS